MRVSIDTPHLNYIKFLISYAYTETIIALIALLTVLPMVFIAIASIIGLAFSINLLPNALSVSLPNNT